MVEHVASAPSAEPFFEFENNVRNDNFNLKPRGTRPGPIPEDQRKICHEVYEAANILKLIKAQPLFGKKADAGSYQEFIGRVLQAATVGCVDKQVDTKLALEALEQIRSDVVRRLGRPTMYRYLLCLAAWGVVGVIVGAILLAASRQWTGIVGYGWVIMGSMAGAWISVAASRSEISFAGIQEFLDVRFEPFIRMLFVGVLAAVFALFLDLNVVTLKIADANLSSFPARPGWALILGVIAGIGEKALSVEVVDRARKVLPSGSS